MSDAAVSILPKVTIQFGKPIHGWLPVIFQAGNFTLEFEASDVPVNPLDLLCEALMVVLSGDDAKVLWNLEPAVYWFSFQPKDESVLLTITEAFDWKHEGVCVLRLTSSLKEILTPFYKVLKDFSSQDYRHPHWPSLERKRITQIEKILQAHC